MDNQNNTTQYQRYQRHQFNNHNIIQRPHSTTPTTHHRLLYQHQHHLRSPQQTQQPKQQPQQRKQQQQQPKQQPQQQQQQQRPHQLPSQYYSQRHQHSWSSPQLLPHAHVSTNSSHQSLIPLPRLDILATSKPSSTRSSPLHSRHPTTPPSPLISPLRYTPQIAGNSLTRANSLPRQIPCSTLNTARLSPASRPGFPKPTPPPHSLLHSSPPPLTRLPTSPIPASAVIGQSGLTVVGRMVEYESDCSRSEAISRALRAASQSGMGRSRHRSRQRSPAVKNRSPGYTTTSANTSPGGDNYNPSCSPSSENLSPLSREERIGGWFRAMSRARPTTMTPPTPADPELSNNIIRTGTDVVMEIVEGETSRSGEFPFGYQAGWSERCSEARDFNEREIEAPDSQASGYISFASLNLFAPPSPPHSLTDFDPLLERQALIRSTTTDIPPSSSHNRRIFRPITP